ncbi:MAG: hypothetical protein A2W61_00385 [Deltaproteobacteria bacterium RIFCSPLOWO2_01_44_7]|nr:MAG: hypothetical protein A2712_00145 [Deltaproteobacteria bacterium RIFCSPHIGHO2_01_FULL_43_49]OGQ15829.1 MAG: hypothetical protein A3D22_02795 [Deltaproteobacteria bacterium RIFCSPHIGHO2_02_FULL_44_53]OGQ28783.1 MAG: hypothetical protein A3D98_01125 [Deltaproteobacteria bacterium RIFCSPHIGHO2_12_FULL_44_21]OGQ32103.1 MAG: hypothetical protein A2979_03250 [Deltaproteobacteria bacterium RIFCSPLOWO2_01_FULL_45_74]OGQ43754.1 MAG: hypothetical protein A3I70_05740 [Deltaproteobacteria bacterium 
MRIASLIASATEIVAALGFADQLVGVSHECDYPPEAVRGKPILTSPKMDVKKRSLEIHEDVQKIVSQGLSVYNIDVAALQKANPDIIVTQDQCEVCAVTYDDVVKATQTCLSANAQIVTLHPDSLDDIFTDILKVGEALKVKGKAEKLVKEIRGKMSEIQKQTQKLQKKPRVLCVEWLNPIMIAGNWIPEMVEMAGGINGITKKGDHTIVVTPEQVKEYNPDMVVVMPCGFTIQQTLENKADLENLPGKIFIVDGNTYMNRPGPRILESLTILAGLFHPDLFEEKIPSGAVSSFV